MNGFEFNKVFVIESLNESEEKLTGKQLYEDLLRWKEYQLKDFNSEYVNISDKNDFFNQIKIIKDSCAIKGYYPIIHFEIHGSNDKNGLVLKSGELITWSEFYYDLIAINSIIGNNLFLTMAVCYGAYIMELIKPNNPSPFWGFIGSFEKIKPTDILIRYNEFYNEFLNSLNLSKAIEILHKSNPSMPSSYRFISSEETFKNINKGYFKKKFTEEQIKERFEKGLQDIGFKIKDRNIKNQFRINFKTELLKTKKEIFEKHKRDFFMFDNFPLNKTRFNIKFEDINNEC